MTTSSSDLLVKVLGFSALLTHGDTLVLDRWRWLCRRLPKTANGETLIDIGCGNGAFATGASLRGYAALGLTWSEEDRAKAIRRSKLCGAPSTTFELCDVRRLADRSDLIGTMDVAICMENIEHVLDDFKLLCDIAQVLKPGGRLLLTTPYLMYRKPVGMFGGVIPLPCFSNSAVVPV